MVGMASTLKANKQRKTKQQKSSNTHNKTKQILALTKQNLVKMVKQKAPALNRSCPVDSNNPKMIH